MSKSIERTTRRQVVAQREVDGVEMGVLDDGTPFLGSRGLARLCGVAPGVILSWLPSFDPSSTKPRDRKLIETLDEQGYSGDLLIPALDGSKHVNAHPEAVCVAVLEYYAFDVGKEQALHVYRRLARRSLRDFIYAAVGYDPANQLSAEWRQFHDRLMLNTLPTSFFGVFREMADVLMSAIQHGLPVDDHTIPDISVGQMWSKHWQEVGGDRRFGARKKHPHEYPDYFPQGQANVEAWIYPVHALGEFRSWLQNVYLPEKYPSYIARKVKMGALEASRAELLLEAIVPTQLEAPDEAPALGT